jgi:hypothetical protein
MLFLVIEHFKNADPIPIGERFRRTGRQLPEGLVYQASWVDAAGARCFQIMETSSPELLTGWTAHWADLVDFEIIPVLTSADFWAQTKLA